MDWDDFRSASPDLFWPKTQAIQFCMILLKIKFPVFNKGAVTVSPCFAVTHREMYFAVNVSDDSANGEEHDVQSHRYARPPSSAGAFGGARGSPMVSPS